jgi:CRISPR-associated protein Cmr2
MTNSFKEDKDYWDRKLAHYLHDPPDKALRIQGHEARSDRLREVLGDLPSCDPDLYKFADRIASGMDRTPLPGYSQNSDQNGAVDFLKAPVLTHPTGDNAPMEVDFPLESIDIRTIQREMAGIIQTDLDGDGADHPGICRFFEGDPDGLAAARFHYVHHTFRDRLTSENVGGLGGLWRRLPADTRIPDHSIWQHCALVSALCSCFETSPKSQASLMVFSITPVQDFIASARKLRDFWTGSLILSWLAFEGIREIIYSLGADHMVYPSLIDQPMVNHLLQTECGLSGIPWREPTHPDVASLPNKWVFLAPRGREKETADRIGERITRAWVDLGRIVLAEIEKLTGRSDEYVSKQFDFQLRHFFDFHYAASPLMDESQQDNFKQLLPAAVWRRTVDFVADTKPLQYESKGQGAFYAVSHSLAQSFLAAGKVHRRNHRPSEKGIKCPIHGDFEILHFASEEDKNPRSEEDPFWKTFRKAWGEHRPDFKNTERLCAVAMVKRIAGIVLEDGQKHPLAPFFKQAFGFASTTEIALTEWFDAVERTQPEMFEKLGEKKETRRRVLAQYVHEADEPEYGDNQDEKEVVNLTSEQRQDCRRIVRRMESAGMPIADCDKYFAIVMMDGDHMGKLINGQTLGSTWRSVIHKDLMNRMKQPDFDARYRTFWEKHGDETRLISPAVHAAISEALGDFSLKTVPAIVEKHHGRLIYAGGDDVCAVFPVATALPAAKEIAEAYGKGFVRQDGSNGSVTDVGGNWTPTKEPVGHHLGAGKGISISAGVLIWHHKRPLSLAIRKAAALLKEKAKEAGGRNAVAIELAKRSGGSRFFVCRWNEQPLASLGLTNGKERWTILDHFGNVVREIAGEKRLSSSFLYRLTSFQPGLEAIAQADPGGMVKFLPSQIKAEKAKEADLERLSADIAALLVRDGKEGATVDPEPLIIARFLAPLAGRFKMEGRT